jgi:hypothetical protein
MKKEKKGKRNKMKFKRFFIFKLMTCNYTIKMTLTAQDAKKGQKTISIQIKFCNSSLLPPFFFNTQTFTIVISIVKILMGIESIIFLS